MPDLSSRVVEDYNTKAMVRVPVVTVFLRGFSCKSRTPMSSKSASNLGCVQNGDDNPETTIAWRGAFQYIKHAWPG